MKVTVTKRNDMMSLIPGSIWHKGKIDCQKVSFDLHMHAVKVKEDGDGETNPQRDTQKK